MSELVEQGGWSGGDRFRCGDGEALMTYVYGESSPAERDAIAAHIARCAVCAEEIAALGSTREQLAAWIPPPQAFGFQITRRPESLTEEPLTADEAAAQPAVTATVLRPAAWWNRPLPAWAQMAAAVVIFGAGLAIGTTRGVSSAGTAARSVPATAAVPTAAVTPSAPGVETVTREELARVEQQLKTEIAQVRTAAPAAAEPTTAMMQRVNQLIAASEARQQRELEFRTAQIVSDFSNRRRIDLANIDKRFGVTTVKMLGNQNDINSLAQRINFTPAYSGFNP
jgi:anti-sigma factor RsiW